MDALTIALASLAILLGLAFPFLKKPDGVLPRWHLMSLVVVGLGLATLGVTKLLV
ncbi:hypothetical protein ACFQ78_34250 [Streptomyces sp. NPDC056519]|uniref:hypothetical protein n=1 Tax=Streptomyces sp. NPDC056519 TaxID=3345849 RepID=UPI0036990E25